MKIAVEVGARGSDCLSCVYEAGVGYYEFNYCEIFQVEKESYKRCEACIVNELRNV